MRNTRKFELRIYPIGATIKIVKSGRNKIENGNRKEGIYSVAIEIVENWNNRQTIIISV